MSSFTDSDFLYINNSQKVALHLSAWGGGFSADAARRGYNAAPASMTEFDLQVLNALDSEFKNANMKDWVDAQRSALVDKLITDAALLIHLAWENEVRKLLLLAAEADNKAGGELLITYDSWRSFVHELIDRGYPIYQWSINFAKLVSIGWQYCAGYTNRDIIPGFYIPFNHSWTHTQFLNALDRGLSMVQGKLHAERIGMQFKPFSQALLDSIWSWIDVNSEVAVFHKLAQNFMYKSGGSAYTTLGPGEIGQSTKDYGEIHMVAMEGKAPHDIWAFTALLYGQYDATHGVSNIKELGPTVATNDYCKFIRSSKTLSTAPSTETPVSTVLGAITGCLTSVFQDGVQFNRYSTSFVFTPTSALGLLHNPTTLHFIKDVSEARWIRLSDTGLIALFSRSVV
jgi:hypothetical protein